MKKFFVFAAYGLVAAIFIGTAVFLFNKSQEAPIIYETVEPFITTIEKRVVATGNVVPRKEVHVTSQVSGVVDNLNVQEGDIVKQGDVLARLALVPNMVALNNADSQLQAARINFENSRSEHERQIALFERQLISESEYRQSLLSLDLKREAYQAAENNFLLIREGSTKTSENVSNVIRATADGMVLQAPHKEGAFIVEASTFGAGTSVAVLADMEDMVFEGLVDEAEMGKIREGMELTLHVGALQDETFSAVLEHIAPKGQTDQGTIKFLIRAAIQLNEDVFLRANYSANADIVLERAENVLAIDEGNLLIDETGRYVEVEVAPQTFEKRLVETGLSDGINIEIRSGLDEGEKIKRL